MILPVLLFYFIAACNPVDPFSCASENYTAERWIGEGAYTDYDIFGPYFTAEDCDAARKEIPNRILDSGGEWPRKLNPWSEQGESLCYAREVRVVLP